MLLGAASCSKANSNKPWIDRIEVDAFEGGEVASLSKDQLKQLLVTRLEAAKFVLPKAGQKIPDDVKPWRLQLAAGLSEPDLETQTSSVVLALELQHTGKSDSFAVDSRVTVKAAQGNDVEAMQNSIRESLDDALGRAVRQAAALITLEDASESTLTAKLKDEDPAIADAAVRLLVRRQNKTALPLILERLKSDDLDTLRGVIGLLVELKAPESVNPLVEAANQRGAVFEREVVFAVGAIGGDDAEAYLDLVATGHDDPLLRASAAQALLELRQKKKPQPPRGDPR
jgi:HEAT repeat protein